MANSFQNAGASQEPSASAPLYTSRIFTGWYTNRSPLRDGVTTHVMDKYGLGRQDSILNGQNMEITPRLTLGRRFGTSAWGANNTYNRINRFYSFNTFTLTSEVIRVMIDDATAVYDAFDGSQKNLIFTKSGGAQSTYFLGVGNTLYFTNGVDNKQVVFNPTTGTWGTVYNWGIVAPTIAPTVTQQPRPNNYPAWAAITGHAPWVPLSDGTHFFNMACIVDTNNNIQGYGYALNSLPPSIQVKSGQLGLGAPTTWGTTFGATTNDGTIQWSCQGTKVWASGYGYAAGQVVVGSIANPAGTPDQMFVSLHGGNSNLSGNPPFWPLGIGQQVSDGTNGLIWQNIGPALHWTDFGFINTGGNVAAPITTQPHIVDPNGYLQTVYQQGRTGASPPSTWVQEIGALTTDSGMVWQNSGPFAVPGQFPIQYGYAYVNAVGDISNMSPASLPITVIQGNAVTVSGPRSTDPQVTTVYIYRTAQGGSTFLYLDQVANPASGPWTYLDTLPDSALNTEIQAQRVGEGTPLPAGATCLAYHLGRIFAAVGNVVWVSSGPDAVASTASGNAGFDTTFTCQSKITRLWATSQGLIVFTVRDAYVIQGNGVDVSVGGSGLFISVWIENLPLLHYDAFTVFGTTAFLYTGKNMVLSLDPGAGMVEVSQPIADVLENLNPATAYLTYHSHNSRDTALYLGNGQDTWHRLSPSIAPESGFAWSLPATPVMGMSALQSVEVTPGVYQLLMGPKVNAGRIYCRDTTTRTDNGTAFPAYADFGVVTLAEPGQLAGVGWMNLEAINVQNEPMLMMLLGELAVTATTPLEPVKRTRHDPPNLPDSHTLDSTRYTFLRGGSPIWCRHLIFRVDFGTNTTADELLSFTIFGSTYQEFAA